MPCHHGSSPLQQPPLVIITPGDTAAPASIVVIPADDAATTATVIIALEDAAAAAAIVIIALEDAAAAAAIVVIALDDAAAAADDAAAPATIIVIRWVLPCGGSRERSCGCGEEGASRIDWREPGSRRGRGFRRRSIELSTL